MAKRKAAAAPDAGAGHRSKRPKTTKTSTKGSPPFVWNPHHWELEKKITDNVSIQKRKATRGQLVVKKILEMLAKDENDEDQDHRPIEIRAVTSLPKNNRVIQPLFYALATPNSSHATAIYPFFPLGDLEGWKQRAFDSKNKKPVPESHIWRLFLQLSQALAFIQGVLGPDHSAHTPLLHRDIKPANVLVAGNGTTYPSFRLHDFGIAGEYQRRSRTEAQRELRCGTFEWQPPENPRINTAAADIWSLGALVHFLAVGQAPLGQLAPYIRAQVAAHGNQHPPGVADYETPLRYYAARIPRVVTPINLSRTDQRARGLAPRRNSDLAPYIHQYSDELNRWMAKCLESMARKRPSADRLVRGMGTVARGMLKKMGGQPALTDIDIEYE